MHRLPSCILSGALFLFALLALPGPSHGEWARGESTREDSASGNDDEDPPAVVESVGLGWPARDVVASLPSRPQLAEARAGRTIHVARGQGWTPLHVRLVNHRDLDLTGTLVVHHGWHDSPAIFEKPISLPRNARKDVVIPVHFTGAPIDVRLLTEELGVVHRSSVLPTVTIPWGAGVLLVASAEPGDFTALVPYRDGMPDERVAVVVIEPQDLPPSALLLEGVAALALDGFPLDELDSEQADAIAAHVASGAILVVSLVEPAARASSLEALLPATPGEWSEETSLPALHWATGVPCRFDHPVPVRRLVPRDDASAWGDGPTVAVSRRHGNGEVVGFGIRLSDSLVAAWGGAPALVNRLVSRGRQRPAWDDGVPAAPVNEARLGELLEGTMARPIPPYRTVLGLLIGFATITLSIPWLLARRWRRRELAWPLIALSAVGAAIAVQAIGSRYVLTQGRALHVTIQSSGAASGPVVRHGFWALFSTRGGRVDLPFDPGTLPMPIFGTGERRAARPLRVELDGPAVVRRYRVYSQDTTSLRTIELRTAAPGPDIQAFLGRRGVRYRMTVPNEEHLAGSWLLVNGLLREVKPGEWLEPWTGEALGELASDSDLLRRLLGMLVGHVENVRPDSTTPVLFCLYRPPPTAWTDRHHEEGWHFVVSRARDYEERTWRYRPERLSWHGERDPSTVRRAQSLGDGRWRFLPTKRLTFRREEPSCAPSPGSSVVLPGSLDVVPLGVPGRLDLELSVVRFPSRGETELIAARGRHAGLGVSLAAAPRRVIAWARTRSGERTVVELPVPVRPEEPWDLSLRWAGRRFELEVDGRRLASDPLPGPVGSPGTEWRLSAGALRVGDPRARACIRKLELSGGVQ